MLASVGAGKALPDDLESGTDGERDGTLLDGAHQPAALPEPVDGQHLGLVLPAAEQVEVALLGKGSTRRDRDHLGLEPPPAQPGGQDLRIAAVAVGTEQLGVDESDPGRRLGAPRAHRGVPFVRTSRSRNAV